MNPPIQVTRSSLPPFEEYVEEIKELWGTHWLTNMGSKHQQLEKELLSYLNTSNLSLFTNGHLALETALSVFNLSGEVITTPFTFASTTHAIIRNGLEPVFCDIDPDNYTIQAEKIENLITEKTSAIVPVHVYGNICNVREIERIAQKYNLKVIYDAAHAFGVTVDGVGVSNFGDASMYSFHATKVFHTIEGGALTFSDAGLKPLIEASKNFGITGQESVEFVGGNAKMNEFQAAMGICNLRNIDTEIAKRKAIYDRYVDQLADIKGIKLVLPQLGVKSNYAYFPIVFEKHKHTRDEVYEILKEHNIFVRKYFYPLTNSFDSFDGRYNPNDTPVANYVAERVLTLPLYASLTLDEVNRICLIIKEVMKR
ncbi:DegT/DnrJ/EryC1/StrS family aminotransferase [Rummeliibacillus sp. JY-2-4R]